MVVAVAYVVLVSAPVPIGLGFFTSLGLGLGLDNIVGQNLKMAKLDIFWDIIKLSRKKRISNKKAGPFDFTF